MYGSNKELIPTFPPYEIYQYSGAMVKHISKNSLKKLEKKCFIVSKVCIITIHHWIEEFIMGVVYQCQLQMQQLKQL